MKEGTAPTYYLASNKPFLKKNALADILMSREHISLDSEMENLTFSLWNPDNRLRAGADFDTCLDVFIEQLLGQLKGIVTLQ